jgi:hypothetical protein
MRTMLAIVSLGAALVCGWLTLMYFILGHEGWPWRAALSGTLAVHCLLAIVAAEGVLDGPWVERMLTGGAILGLGFALAALAGLAAAPHFEGFWIPVAVVVLAQAVLTLAVFGRAALLSKA